ncbi:hypothetical protein [Amycolatopsis sp. WAC 04169]|uniref:AAA family ATPase n=1 Tax=Amycolatopsis sp. WAC 04169 TaxID=2203197 RepID=UPI0018F29D82|nr:hypothetical protein [Amycolatopsis sp. WAC 04169]
MAEVVILIGLQASGKSTFFRWAFAGTHVHLSKDHFPNAKRRQPRQLRMLAEALEEGRSVVVDNTNPFCMRLSSGCGARAPKTVSTSCTPSVSTAKAVSSWSGGEAWTPVISRHGNGNASGSTG